MGTEMAFQHEGLTCGAVRITSMSGRQRIDGATLLFSGDITLDPLEVGFLQINGVAGHIDVQGGGDLGPIWPLNSFRVRTSQRGERTSFCICVAARDSDIRSIDRLRIKNPTEPLKFVLWLRLLGWSPRGPIDPQAVLNYPVTNSDWSAALASAQYESRHIIDIPIRGGRVGGELATAAEHYCRALEQFKKASYTQVFVESRKVVESIRDVLGLTPKGITEFDARQKNAWSNRECIEYARASIHQIMHHAAHPGVTDDPGPGEAELVLALTGSLLRYYATVR